MCVGFHTGSHLQLSMSDTRGSGTGLAPIRTLHWQECFVSLCQTDGDGGLFRTTVHRPHVVERKAALDTQ